MLTRVDSDGRSTSYDSASVGWQCVTSPSQKPIAAQPVRGNTRVRHIDDYTNKSNVRVVEPTRGPTNDARV